MRQDLRGILASCGIVCLAAAVWIGYWRFTIRPARRIHCVTNLLAIAKQVQVFATAHRGVCPRSLEALFDARALPPETFICPASGSEPVEGRFVCDYDSLFDRSEKAVTLRSIDHPASVPMAWDERPVHGQAPDRYRYVVYMDGRLEEMPERAFQTRFRTR